MKKKILKLIFGIIIFISIIITLFIFYINRDEKFIMPVKGASKKDYDQHSFGQPRSGHRHKGVDIFAKKGTPVMSSTNGIVIFTGVLSLGGKVVLIFGPKFRIYYYAHLDRIDASKFNFVCTGDILGTVGNTGNAKLTPSHLHFSIRNIFPHKKVIYVDPVPEINRTFINKNQYPF